MGRLSISVLDTMNGRPAAGVEVALHQVGEGGARTLVRHTFTNVQGRTDPPLMDEGSYRVGAYDIEFQMGSYFRQAGATLADPPLFDQVTIRLNLSDPEGQYLVPLIAAPWGYQLYRGN